MLSVTFFLQHFVWSFMLYIKVMIVTMLKMTVDINYLAYSHPCPFSEFVPFFPPYPLLACLLFCCIKPRCFKLYCTAGASWVPVSRMLAHTASILWAMQIIVYLTDVPCIFHIATWLCLQWVKSFFSFPLLNNMQFLSPPNTLYFDLILTCTFPAPIIEINGIDSLEVNGFCCQGEQDAL